jgi:hypothetical protein
MDIAKNESVTSVSAAEIPSESETLHRESALHSLNALMGAPVTATDGAMGTVHNFLFDDQSWTIRYLVIDVGSWLERRYVLLSTAVFDYPDWAKKTFHAHLTRDQVRHSPDIDTHKPVSRQQEIAMHEYFGWPGYWADWYFPFRSIRTQLKYPLHTKEDPHLRSALSVLGYDVSAIDGPMGQLEDFIVEKATWHLNYIVVRAGDWLCEYPLVVSTRWVKSVLWDTHHIYLDHAREEL